MADRSYEAALEALGGLISGKKRPDGSSWAHAFESMPTHLKRLALDSRLQDLHVVHVAGTKGKGSTCALVESMLRNCGYRTGLYTSPHLCDVRERIRLDGKPIGRDRFLKHFWHVYDTLKQQVDDKLAMPAYFRFLTLLALYVFLEEGVEAVVLEVGLGGRLDATNCIPPPGVTAVTPLGFDHMELLGNTLREIAGEKAGIFKHGSPAFTVPQEEEAMLSLQAKADAVGVNLRVVRPWATFTSVCPSDSDAMLASSQLAASNTHSDKAAALSNEAASAVPSIAAVADHLTSQGAHQLVNAALAVLLAATWEQRTASALGVTNTEATTEAPSMAPSRVHPGGPAPAGTPAGDAFCARLQKGIRRAELLSAGVLPAAYAQGLLQAQWPGRCQVVEDPTLATPSPLTFYLDGAHTPESMLVAADWFATVTSAPVQHCNSSTSDTTTNAAQPSIVPTTSIAANGAPQQKGALAGSPERPPERPCGTLPPLRLLLFHCMDDRDPETLLKPLLARLAEKGALVQHALFVPPDSAYANLSKQQGLPETAARYAWHIKMRGVYESLQHHTAASSQLPKNLPTLPPLPTIPGMAAQNAAQGAVLTNLRATIDWLRKTAMQGGPKGAPRRVQVLVTGSLYLVGDMLRLLDKAP